MREQQFRELLEKYLNGSISEKENSILEKFNANMASKNRNLQFSNESDKKDFKESLWKDIKAGSDFNKSKNLSWRLIAASAAIFTGILFGYFYINNSVTSLEIIPENAITLELEDGSLKIIEENGSFQVKDKTGTALSQQKGNQLIYSETSQVKKLVFNTLTVPFGKKFELKLSDGTIAILNSGSSLKYPVKFLDNQDRSVFISGEVYLKVAKDSVHPFIVKAGELSVRVLGTQFNVSAYPEEEITEVVLVEGSVSLISDIEEGQSKNEILLEPGYKGSFNKKDGKITEDKVVTDLYTSWIKGELIFRDMTFENIIKKFERHYNISIVNKNKVLSTKKFNANFGDEPIEKVLEELKLNYGVDYEINYNGQIVIE